MYCRIRTSCINMNYMIYRNICIQVGLHVYIYILIRRTLRAYILQYIPTIITSSRSLCSLTCNHMYVLYPSSMCAPVQRSINLSRADANINDFSASAL